VEGWVDSQGLHLNTQKSGSNAGQILQQKGKIEKPNHVGKQV